MPSVERKQLMDSATKASDVAKRVATLGNDVEQAGTTEHPTEQQAAALQQRLKEEENLEDEWYQANENLTAAWGRLESAAQQDAQDASRSAGTSRFVAWIRYDPQRLDAWRLDESLWRTLIVFGVGRGTAVDGVKSETAEPL